MVDIQELIKTKAGRIAISQQSPAFFMSYYLGLDIDDHHNTWLDRVKHKRLHEEAPRDHGKSTIFSFGYPVWKLCKSTVAGDVDENIRILVVSQTGGPTGVSSKVKDVIITELKENKKILADFGEIITREKGGSIFCKRTKSGLKDPSLESIGVGGAITGGHYDLIIADDLIDDKNSRTDLMRQQVEDWFKGTLMELLEPDSQIIVVGTRKHYSDLYQYIIENKLWTTFIDKAIIKYPDYYVILASDDEGYDEMTPEYAAEHGGELKIINNVKIYVEGDYEVLWKEKWHIHQLLYNKYDIGSIIFNREKQNDPSGMKGKILNTGWIKEYKGNDIDISDLHIYMGVDLAASEKETADYMAICVCGYDPINNKIYVLYFWRGHLTFPEQVNQIHTTAQKWKPMRITIESNAYQNAMIQFQHSINMLPIVGSPTAKDKVTRMLALSPQIENGKIMFDPDIQYYDTFLEEFSQFPYSAHDDMLDSLEICVRPIVATGEVHLGKFMDSKVNYERSWFEL